MMDIACECGHGSTQHIENEWFGYRCTICACALLRSRPRAPRVEVPDEDYDDA